MKKFSITIACIIILFCFSAKCQSSGIDYIESNSIVFKKQSVTQSINLISGNSQQLITIFGNSGNISTKISEIDGETYTRYKYSNNSFWFANNKITSVEFKTKAFYINYNKSDIKVGDNVSVLSSVFPNSYPLKREGVVHIGLKRNGTLTDSFLVIEYNTSNIISEIGVQ